MKLKIISTIRNYQEIAQPIFSKNSPKHPWLNKKLYFNIISAVEKTEKINADVPTPSSLDQETNIADNEYSTPITRSKGGWPKGSMLKIKMCMELATTVVLNAVASNFIK